LHSISDQHRHYNVARRGKLREFDKYGPKADNPSWIKALADVRHMGPREGYCYQHVQAIMLSIDQYAESALGNRAYFPNKLQSIDGMNDKIPE
jgi:hypothetical protein